jgi:hypothetical protein
MAYSEDEIKEMRERAKREYEAIKKEREEQRKRKELEEKMKEEVETRAWRNVIAEETRYFNPKQKAIWKAILDVLGRTEETLQPSDIGFALSQENEIKYQLIALINELIKEKLDMGTMEFTERTWYDAGQYYIGQVIGTNEYIIHGFGVKTQLIKDENGVPKTILMEIPSKLIPNVNYVGELKVHIATSNKPKESTEPINNKVQEKKTKFSLFK